MKDTISDSDYKKAQGIEAILKDAEENTLVLHHRPARKAGGLNPYISTLEEGLNINHDLDDSITYLTLYHSHNVTNKQCPFFCPVDLTYHLGNRKLMDKPTSTTKEKTLFPPVIKLVGNHTFALGYKRKDDDSDRPFFYTSKPEGMDEKLLEPCVLKVQIEQGHTMYEIHACAKPSDEVKV